ncbi:MAG: thiol-disulfide oxidoreductase DCC family protein [Dehalococcoidia bacterium]
MRWVQRNDLNGKVDFHPNDRDSVHAVSPDIDPTKAARTIVAVDGNGVVFYGAQAISLIISCTGGFSGFLGRIFKKRFASMLLEPFYRLFAKHRGRIAFLFHEPS